MPLIGPSNRLQSYSAIIFVSTCSRCQQTAAILRNMDVDCVALHSIMTQRERMQALNKFKSMTCRILIATDVASRGLDIPTGTKWLFTFTFMHILIHVRYCCYVTCPLYTCGIYQYTCGCIHTYMLSKTPFHILHTYSMHTVQHIFVALHIMLQ